MKNKLNNTVIKVLDREHGKKVIEWWQSQGVDTNDYLGLVDESRGYKAIYYGLVHGIFRNVDASTVNVIDLKVIELPSIEQPKFFAISPEDWKEYQELKRERNKVDISKLKTGSFVMLKYTGQMCGSIGSATYENPFEVVFFKTKHGINNQKEYFAKAAYESYCTFYQEGEFVLFSSHEEIDYITEVISY